MLENKEQEKIAGIISDFFDGAVTEADIDILTMQIYEKYVAKLEKELAELKEKAIVPKFKIGEEVYHLLCNDGKETIVSRDVITSFYIEKSDYSNKIIYALKKCRFYANDTELFATLEEAQAKLQELRGDKK